MDKLENLRHEIDECDQALVKAFERRMEIVLEVLDFKKNHGLPILHKQREEQVLQRVESHLENKEFSREIKELYQELMRLSRRIQSRRMFPHNIVLIGFMGTGKSSVGACLSKLLEMECIDIDQWIEKQEEMSIAQIFESYGEPYFRELERVAVKELCRRDNVIISCGGGIILNQENMWDLRRNGKIVLLKAKPETIYERLKEDTTRPLLKNKMSVSLIEEKMAQRERLYIESADRMIDTDKLSIEETAKEIIHQLLQN